MTWYLVKKQCGISAGPTDDTDSGAWMSRVIMLDGNCYCCSTCYVMYCIFTAFTLYRYNIHICLDWYDQLLVRPWKCMWCRAVDVLREQVFEHVRIVFNESPIRSDFKKCSVHNVLLLLFEKCYIYYLMTSPLCCVQFYLPGNMDFFLVRWLLYFHFIVSH